MMNWNNNRTLLILGGSAILAVGMIASSFALSRFMVRIRQQEENTITTRGLAERKITSDIGALECTVGASGKTQEEGFKKLSRSYTLLKFVLKKAGFKDGELEEGAPDCATVTKPVRTRDSNNRETFTEEFSHFRYTRTLRIVSRQVDLVHGQSMELANLVLSGVEITVGEPAYYVSDLEQYKLELVAEATDAAMKRARITAEKCDSKVGRLITARNGIIQITRPASSDISDSGYYDTTSREKIMKVVVSATFEAE